jgi:N-acetyl-gamma-glutamyl-phosphate reductase
VATAGQAISTVVIGATGYSGGELVGLLAQHARARIVGLFGSGRRAEGDRPTRIADYFPRLLGRIDMEIRAAEVERIRELRPDAVFLATPHEASIDLVQELTAAAGNGWSPRIFDLSGAFRLRPASLYDRYYGFTHARPDLLERAVYGLAELNRGEIAGADLVAVPGCYPTSAILPLAPLVKAGAIERGRRPIIDSTSGVSGAGRTPTAKTHFCEISLQPYNVLKHRHNPEIDLHAGVATVFTPHLGAFDRGILSTIHVDLAEGWTGRRVADTLNEAYGSERFIRLLPADRWPSVAGVRQTNFCDIGWAIDEANRHLILVSAIDNLVKGAAGQAVQCMNIRFDLPEAAGLEGGSL